MFVDAVIPAKAGIQGLLIKRHWIPAFAGMTVLMLVVEQEYHHG